MDVQKLQIGPQPARLVYRILAVDGLGADFSFGLGFEHRTDLSTQQLMVIRDQDFIPRATLFSDGGLGGMICLAPPHPLDL
jgi:hypothetical protein